MPPSEKSSRKPRINVVLAIALCGVTAALAVSLVKLQRLNRLEKRVDVPSIEIETQASPAMSISENNQADSPSEAPVPPNSDAASYELVGVKPVPSQQPDADRVYSIRADGAPARGPDGAPVTIVQFSDFQCSFCKNANPTLKRIGEVYGRQVRLVWKHLPLSMHTKAPTAHLASVAAARQGRFWEFHDKLFEHQDKLNPEDLRQYALDVGLSMQKFEEDLIRPETRQVVEEDMNEAVSIALTASPGFFINGRYLRGAKPFEDFAALINTELDRLGLPVPPAARVKADVKGQPG